MGVAGRDSILICRYVTTCQHVIKGEWNFPGSKHLAYQSTFYRRTIYTMIQAIQRRMLGTGNISVSTDILGKSIFIGIYIEIDMMYTRNNCRALYILLMYN
jgi:hypothetical protein